MRTDLAAWQWQGYPTFHQRRSTLLIHAVAVPSFVVASVALVWCVATFRWMEAVACALAMVLAFAAQAIAHKREADPPIPFEGASDIVTRIFLEQFFTFPRFVLSGGWWRALRR